jgi:putative acetyltransferase
MEVRAEKPEDIEAICRVNIAAFERESEANLVEQLRGTDLTFSFVAVESKQVVGHLFFSRVALKGECTKNLLILGLAPVAVLPNYQRQGIGSLLIQYGLNESALFGVKAVVVLGSPAYYPRFGFTLAREKGLRCKYAVPDEAFMVLELEAGALKGCFGTVKYQSEFDKLK